MFRKALFILSILLCLTGCTAITPSTPSPSPAVTINGNTTIPAAPTIAATATSTATVSSSASAKAAAELTKLMPAATGFRWRYFGFAEYSATLTLQSIKPAINGTVYTATGSVDDMSGGAGKGDFNITATYTAGADALRQSLKGKKAMDNVYPDLELLRLPLRKGAQWTQQVKDSSGKAVTMDCTITDVRSENSRTIYSVRYQVQNGDYYETRDITEGLGVTAFQRLYRYESGSDLIGYRYESSDASVPQDNLADAWLPKLGVTYSFCGLAEYGHKGMLQKVSSSDKEELYQYNGQYQDGTGRDDRFVVQYRVDRARGTVTEQVLANTRGAAEVNSRLHNLVILKFPLSLGETWSHRATLNGKAVTVRATVTQYDEAAGRCKVRYTAKADGYYAGTYLEERTFEKGMGMTSFSNLMPGAIGISQLDAGNPTKLADALVQHSFGYSINRTPVSD